MEILGGECRNEFFTTKLRDALSLKVYGFGKVCRYHRWLYLDFRAKLRHKSELIDLWVEP